MKIRKFIQIIFITCFIFFLVAAMYFTVDNKDKEFSYYENRNYAKMPVISKASFYEGTYLDELDTFLNDHSAFRDGFVRLQTYLDAVVLKRPVVNDIVVTDEALLAYKDYITPDEESIKQKADDIAQMNNALRKKVESYGGTYIYTAVPCQYACYEDAYPSYLNNMSAFTDLEIGYLSEYMAKYGVNFIDMLPVFQSADDPLGAERVGESLFYSSRIDNHYDAVGGYIVYKAIVDMINDKTEYNLDFPEGDDIKFIAHELPYRGSRTRKLMDTVNINEHIHRVEFSEKLPIKQYSGPYEVPVKLYDEEYSVTDGMITYGYYMGGDLPQTIIDTDRDDLPSVLIYGDSFTNTVEVMAYYSFNKMHTLDLRHYDEMTIQQYIDKYKPEIVVCIRDYEAVLSLTGNGEIGNKPV